MSSTGKRKAERAEKVERSEEVSDAESLRDDEDEEHERKAKKKAKKARKEKHHAPQLTITSVPSSPALGPAAASAPKSKLDQIRALMESMTEEEKSMAAAATTTTSTALVPAAAASASKSSAQEEKETKVAVRQNIVATMDESEDYEGPERSFMDLFDISYKALLPKVKFGRVRCTHPDHAMALWLGSEGNKMHVLHFRTPEDIAQIKVQRNEEKKQGAWDPKLKRKEWKGTGTFYVNISGNFDQRWQGEKLKGFALVSCFGWGGFGKIGPTVATGIEGDRGREFDGKAKNDIEASYGVSITNKALTHLAKDPRTFTNPTMDAGMQVVRNITKHIATQTFNIDGSLPKWRANRNEKNKEWPDMNRKQQLAHLLETQFAGKVIRDKKQDVDHLKVSSPCLRTLHYGEVADGYFPPSELFEKFRVDDKGRILIHNRQFVYAARPHDEVKPGEKYTAPFYEVPFPEAVIDTYRDVFLVVHGMRVYEWKQNRCDVTHPIIGFIWLNTKAAIEGMSEADIVPCDPRYAIPWAGHYVPLSQRPLDPDDPDYRAPAAAAAAASGSPPPPLSPRSAAAVADATAAFATSQ